jgi:hypothetical protein
MKPEFYWQIFEKYSNIKLHEIRPVEAELFHADRQMDRRDKANSCYLQFCEHTKKV